jgi:hypothetical protein
MTTTKAPAVKTGAKTGAKTKSPALAACPFCRKTDRLIRGYMAFMERPDGSEFEGELVRCLRCDCMVPLAVWKKHGTTPPNPPAATRRLPKNS